MSNFIKSYQANVGLNHTPAYQVSGQPFAKGGINAASSTQTVNFPYVTRWVVVNNNSGTVLKVGFSSRGIAATEYFDVLPNSSSPRLEVKVSQIFLNGGSGATVSVVAGLTSIPSSRVDTTLGTSWSGSSGVG
jgi:hypothetical protein